MSLQSQSYFSVSSVGVPIRNTADYSPFGVQLDGRTIQGDFYRRGFNGMEKDDEVKGGGNSYDFGARMYDARVGRWLSLDVMSSVYPGSSNYVALGNSPIVMLDSDGKILRDKAGNIIATGTGTYENSYYELSNTTDMLGNTHVTSISIKYEVVQIYANDGTPHKALKMIESKTKSETYDSKGMLVSSNEGQVDKNTFDVVSDCHGYTFTENALWINDDDVQSLLVADGYLKSNQENADIVIFSNNGKTVHSAKRNSNGTYTNNAGIMKTETVGTVDEALRGIKSNSRKFYKEPSDKKFKYLGDGKKTSTGFKMYSKKEISDAANKELIEFAINKIQKGLSFFNKIENKKSN